MGQKFSSYIRRGQNGSKARCLDEDEDEENQATNIDQVPHPNETLGLRIKLFGPTNVILLIRTNPSSVEGSSPSEISASPSRDRNSSAVYCRIHAHREVLCRGSKYFHSMLRGPHKSNFRNNYRNSIENCDELTYCEKSDEEVNLVIIYKKSPTEMADMVGQVLHFLYFNQRALNPENVQTLLEAANYFQVRLVFGIG